ncbi:MAG: hypothetical protein IPL35_00375 [Sphingobacteriales bacterium]|nr:hypothetical protein [Sphingobacteriales bacterium]
MKKILFLSLLLLAATSTIFAQSKKEQKQKEKEQKLQQMELEQHLALVEASKKQGTVVRSRDTVYKAGTPYCLLKARKKFLVSEYTVCNLAGKPLIDVPYDCIENMKGGDDLCYYRFLFLESGAQAELQMYLGLKIERLVAEYELVLPDGSVNPEGEKRFLMNYPPRYSKVMEKALLNSVSNGSHTKIILIQRDTDEDIHISDNNIRQDNVLIGRYQRGKITQDIEELNNFLFYTPAGVLVAEAVQQHDDLSSQYRIHTISDNADFNITLDDLEDEAEQLADYLVQKGYL